MFDLSLLWLANTIILVKTEWLHVAIIGAEELRAGEGVVLHRDQVVLWFAGVLLFELGLVDEVALRLSTWFETAKSTHCFELILSSTQNQAQD